jgi:hypothetical protein
MAAPVLEQAQGTTSDNATVTTYSNFAVGSASDRTLLAIVTFEDFIAGTSNTVASVVFNTTENFSEAHVGYNDYGGDDRMGCEIWRLDNPSNATADVVATMDANVIKNTHLIILEFSGANNGIGANKAASTGSSGSYSISLTSLNSDSLVVTGLGDALHTAAPFSPGSGDTEAFDSAGANNDAWAGYTPGTGGSVTITATETGSSGAWAMCAVELLAAAGGPAGRTTKNTDPYGLGIASGVSRTFKVHG